jgi:hypothetical protein
MVRHDLIVLYQTESSTVKKRIERQLLVAKHQLENEMEMVQPGNERSA